jgi:hypothetical protein
MRVRACLCDDDWAHACMHACVSVIVHTHMCCWHYYSPLCIWDMRCDAMHARTTTTFASLFWPAGQIGSDGQPEPDRRMHASYEYMVTELATRRRCSACAARVGPRARMAPLLTAMHAVPGWSDRWVRTHACSTLDRTCVRSTTQLATSSARLASHWIQASASSL